MKTAIEVKSDIEMLIKLSEKLPKTENEYKKNQGMVSFLRKCLEYLEGEPREDFVIKMRDSLLNKKELILKGFADWQKFNGDVPIEKQKSTYQRQVGLAEINNQLKYLNFILQ